MADTTPRPAKPDEDRKPFASWLMEQAGGKTEQELTDGLRDLVARVNDTGKKGSLSLVVNVAPMKGDPSMLVVSDEIKLKLPEHDRKASIFWTDDANNLVRNDPNQRSFFEEITHDGKTVDTTTGEVAD